MIDKVYGLLGDQVTPAVVSKDIVGQGDGPVALQVGGVRPSTNWSLADEVWSQSGVQSLLYGLLLLAGVLRATKPLQSVSHLE